MIEVNNISFSYPGQKERVFDGFSLRVEESKIYGLLGKNGTGKSERYGQVDAALPHRGPAAAAGRFRLLL